MAADLGLAYLHQSLKRGGHESHYVDNMLEPLGAQGLVERFGRRGPWILGAKLFTHQIREWRAFVRAVKALDPHVVTVGGGHHPSAVVQDVFDNIPEMDYGFASEGEIGFPMFATAIENGAATADLEKVPGLVFRRNGEVVANPTALVEDINDLDAPPWDDLPVREYLKHKTPLRNAAMTPLTTTRGCPYRCTYCAGFRVAGRGMRYRDSMRVVDEIEFLHRKYGVESVSIQDENFSVRKHHVQDFCRTLIDRKLPVRWDGLATGVRLDGLDLETYKLMEQSGCHAISVAIESADQTVLKEMKKGTYIDDQAKRIREIKTHTKIRVNGYFILGYPTQNAESIQLTRKFARRSELDFAFFFLFTPLPGTAVTKLLVQDGRLAPDIWETFQYDAPSLPLPDMTPTQLKRAQMLAYLGFYLRGRRFVTLLKAVFGAGQFRDLCRRLSGTFLWRRSAPAAIS
ncbi:B12-binding domain-containing radical SAM protein [bacterium]|nr:B12-binding domain-containing radical SAM protein [bacterium]